MATSTISCKYNLADYQHIMQHGFNIELPSNTVSLVCELAELVGAPSYVKTPNFPMRGGGGGESENGHGHGHGHRHGHHEDGVSGGSGGGGGGGRGRRNKPQEIAQDEWESIRAFQKTEIQKKEGLDAHVDNVRSYLNKLTDKTYDDMLNNICAELKSIAEELAEDAAAHEEAMRRVGNSVFQTASSNTFYSSMYARLFKDLMERFDIFKRIFDENMSEYMKLFNRIECVDPKKDYDRFCQINKMNENRKAMSLFIVNLMKNGIVDADSVLDIIHQLQDLLFENIRTAGRVSEVDELSENLFIIIKNCHAFLATKGEECRVKLANRMLKVTEVSAMKVKTHPSISNKSIFKHMDILDEVNGTKRK